MKKKIPLSIKNIEAIKESLSTLADNLKESKETISSEIANYAVEEISKNHEAIPYKDGNDDYTIFKEKTELGYRVGARGSQVLYDEFGTGTEGINAPHELKKDFNLNEYNSGKTIRSATIKTKPNIGIFPGELYWTYKDKNGEKVYTQGIPAGKEIFNAENTIKREGKTMIEKKVGDMLSKL